MPSPSCKGIFERSGVIQIVGSLTKDRVDIGWRLLDEIDQVLRMLGWGLRILTLVAFSRELATQHLPTFVDLFGLLRLNLKTLPKLPLYRERFLPRVPNDLPRGHSHVSDQHHLDEVPRCITRESVRASKPNRSVS